MSASTSTAGTTVAGAGGGGSTGAGTGGGGTTGSGTGTECQAFLFPVCPCVTTQPVSRETEVLEEGDEEEEEEEEEEEDERVEAAEGVEHFCTGPLAEAALVP